MITDDEDKAFVALVAAVHMGQLGLVESKDKDGNRKPMLCIVDDTENSITPLGELNTTPHHYSKPATVEGSDVRTEIHRCVSADHLHDDQVEGILRGVKGTRATKH